VTVGKPGFCAVSLKAAGSSVIITEVDPISVRTSSGDGIDLNFKKMAGVPVKEARYQL